MPAPRPVRADSLSCRSPSALRSGSLSARIEACASRARHQALQVAEDGAGLGAGEFVGLEDVLELRRGSARRGCRQAQLGAAVEQAAGDFLEAVQVLAEQEDRVGADALDRQELVGRLADALGQHHQLAGGRDLGNGRALLHLERGHRLGHFQQVGRLAVDVAQRGADLGQDLLLRQHRLGVLLGAVGQRRDRGQLGVVLAADPFQLERVVAVGEASHAAGQVVRALAHLGEGRHHADQRLRHRLGQPLRLHQRLAGGGHLLGQPFGAQDGRARDQQQEQHHRGQQHRQQALLARRVGALRAAQARAVRGYRLGGGDQGRRRIGRLQRLHRVRRNGLGLDGLHRLARRRRRLGGGVAVGVHELVFVGLQRLRAFERQGARAGGIQGHAATGGGEEFLEFVGDRAHGRSFNVGFGVGRPFRRRCSGTGVAATAPAG